jgi:signal transduction histidine kinase/CheY-like chemotaxis protein
MKFPWRFTPEEIMRFITAYAVVVIAAKFGQYLYFGWQTSPAILWPATGIAFSLVWLWGYKYWLPIFLALFTSTVTGPSAHLIPAVVTTPLAQVLGVVAAAHALRIHGFNGSFSRTRNVTLFLVIATISCAIAPTVTTAISALTGNLTVTAYYSWSRSWAGYLLSMLVLAPLIISWSRAHYAAMRGRYIEPLAAGALVVLSVYGLFWRPLPEEFSFLMFVVFFIAHFWVCLRFPTFIVTASLSFTTIFGILGLFINPNPERPLNEQLFAAELFLFLVLPIFYAFYALVRERMYAVIELQEAMRKLERESGIKSDFIAVLAHELRNPLAPVKTTLEILSLEENPDPEIKKLIASAHRQVHSMRRLLDDLLDVNRVTQGKFELRPERAQLCALLANCLEATKSLNDRGHTFAIEPRCDESIWLQVDPVRFEQAVVNLLNNASKYTEPGGYIVISPVVRGDLLELSIKDNGAGIDEADLENIFQPFWQAGTARASASGIGVGLAITRHIIELHGGTIKATSKGKGMGSVFTIRLPIPPQDRGAMEPLSQPMNSVPRARILVVDDNRAAADSMTKLLSLKGHEARAVYSGTDALAAAGEYQPSLILLDIGLPDMTGYEVAERLRTGGYARSLIALSGYGQEEDRERARLSGCDDHFIKPMSIARLEEYLTTTHG